jgi:hypothetical protein
MARPFHVDQIHAHGSQFTHIERDQVNVNMVTGEQRLLYTT